MEARPSADLIFATNKPGSHFGDIEFALLGQGGVEPIREFSVKAKTDMDLLFLEKGSLYSIDNEFKATVFSLFEKSLKHYGTLQAMRRKSKEWLHRKERTHIIIPGNSTPQNGSYPFPPPQ